MRLLIIDDEAPIRFAVRDYFTTLGYEVDGAASVDEARALLDRGGYAVVLADLRLGQAGWNEGLSLAHLARLRDPVTRVVILTAYGSPEAVAEALRIGVDAFLHKPQALSDLAEIVRRVTRP